MKQTRIIPAQTARPAQLTIMDASQTMALFTGTAPAGQASAYQPRPIPTATQATMPMDDADMDDPTNTESARAYDECMATLDTWRTPPPDYNDITGWTIYSLNRYIQGDYRADMDGKYIMRVHWTDGMTLDLAAAIISRLYPRIEIMSQYPTQDGNNTRLHIGAIIYPPHTHPMEPQQIRITFYLTRHSTGETA